MARMAAQSGPHTRPAGSYSTGMTIRIAVVAYRSSVISRLDG
jgi:hypothetical protein